MRQSHPIAAALVACGVVTGIGWSYAQQRSGPPTFTTQDKTEILELYGRYNQGTDFQEAALWLGVFSHDAVFKPGDGQEYVGMKALTDWRMKNFAGRKPERQTRHWNSSWVITPTPEGAKGRVYWLGLDVSGKQPMMGGSGWYEDVYVKTADGWRIKERVAKRDVVTRPTQ